MFKKAKNTSSLKTFKGLDWKKIWEDIKSVRKIKGKRGNLSQFIMKDRGFISKNYCS